MNTLVLPKDVIHLKYKNQSQNTQKKLLDFLVTKNISFYEANPKNFEAIVQIYNIKSNKPKSLSKSPSAHPNTSKSPLKSSQKKIVETPQKITTSSPNLNSSKKKQKTAEKDQKKQETLKKRNPSSHDSSKTKAKGNIFLEELQKNIGNQGNNKERKLTKESMKEKENVKKISTEEEIKSSRPSQQRIPPENSNRKTKPSMKNESSMRILQKNKQILDNMINAHSVLEFEANKHQNNGNNNGKNKENIGEPSLSHESQENEQSMLPRENHSNSVSKNQKKMKNSQKGSFLKGGKSKMSVSQEKTKENNQNRKISERMESNFKEIVKKEFSRVPSGEKLNKNSINLQFQKAVQILYERLDLLSSEELIFYYKFIVSKAKKLYLDFLQKRGLIVN